MSLYKKNRAKEERNVIFEQFKVQLPKSIAAGNQLLHWYENATKDSNVKVIVDLYRELEQIRFVDATVNKFNPELLDNFIQVLDDIFDLRLPPLLHVLRHFESRKGVAEKYSKSEEIKIYNFYIDENGEVATNEISLDLLGDSANQKQHNKAGINDDFAKDAYLKERKSKYANKNKAPESDANEGQQTKAKASETHSQTNLNLKKDEDEDEEEEDFLDEPEVDIESKNMKDMELVSMEELGLDGTDEWDTMNLKELEEQLYQELSQLSKE